MKIIKRLVMGTAALALAAGLFATAQAQEFDEAAVAEFYSGKTVTMIIRSAPGGGYDFYGRLLARHMGKYIPGNPEVIPVNRPGAGGLVALNYLFNRAPRDGTEMMIAGRDLVTVERSGADGVEYRTMELNALGSCARSTYTWLAGPDVPVDSLDDLAAFDGRFTFAASGRGASSYNFALLLQKLGYPVDIVTGYEGTNDRNLAVLRGEVDGNTSAYESLRDVIQQEGFKPFAKMGNHPDLEAVADVRDGLSGDALALANFMAAPLLAGRPFFTAPEVPEDRVAALRHAFRLALEDKALLEEAARAGRAIGYTSPEEIETLYQDVLGTPDDVLAELEG
jgi:tripartite-type tricarboxylate transporter receptor subunit TctC